MSGASLWFIGTATTEYQPGSGLARREALVEEVDRMASLFRGLGYQVLPGVGLNLSRLEFVSRLRRFLTDPARSSSDVVVVYYAGHGVVQDRELLLPMADAGADLVFDSLPAGDLSARLMAGRMPVRQVLFLLDRCQAAVGGAAIAQGGMEFVNRLRSLTDNPSVAVVVASRPQEQAVAGVFGPALVKAVHGRAAGGFEPQFLPLDELVGVVNDATPPWQHARLFAVTDRVTAFFPNPHVDQSLREVDLQTRRLHHQQAARRGELSGHVWPRARGLDSAQAGDLWLFTGRDQALREVCHWLTASNPAALLVTGDPGSGKSALLSRLFVLADRHRRARVPNLEQLPADTIPADGSIRRFVHASGKTAAELLDAIAEGCELRHQVSSPGQLLQALGRGGQRVTLIVDAVDEAVGDPQEQAHGRFPPVDEVLAPLARGAATTGLRLLIGARRHLIGRFDQAEQIDLDKARYADATSMCRYAEACLLELSETSPYRHQPQTLVREVAGVIAEAAGTSFLVALITARSLALRDTPADPYDRRWVARLPRLAADAMRDDLTGRLGEQAQRARDLLLPLAYARGDGLPWADLWPAIAGALAGRQYSSDDIDWLIEICGYYIVEATDGHRSRYRLYHEALAEHLRDGRDHTSDEALITEVLESRARLRADGHRDWATAHPYITDHLAGRRRIWAAPEASHRIALACDLLPLALRIVGARLATQPGIGLPSFAERLEDEGYRLEELSVGDISMRGSFSESYRTLDPDTRAALRALGSTDEIRISGPSASRLMHLPSRQSNRLIERLVHHSLLTPVGTGATGQEYEMSSLLRIFTRECDACAEP